MNRKKILLVDDSAFDRQLLRAAFARQQDGYELLEARSGEECLELLARSRVDLILMDLVMPGLSGQELLASVRQKSNSIDLPVIMVTSRSDAADIVGCLRAGANDYITKPVHFEVALSRIETQLRLRELSAEHAQLQKMSAVHALVTTYNHEINNPLTIVMGNVSLARFKGRPLDPAELEPALHRIAEIVAKIRDLTDQKDLRLEDYSSSSKMVSLKKTG